MAGHSDTDDGIGGRPPPLLALAAVTDVLGDYRQSAEDRLPGVLDGEVEDLHQFRVSVRRARSIIEVSDAVLPARARDRASRALRSIARLSSPVRDFDVFIEDLPELLGSLPGRSVDEAAIAALGELAAAARERPSVSLEWALRGPDGRAMFDAWAAVCSSAPPGGEEPGPLATTPAGELTDEWTMDAFSRTRRRGRAALASDDLEDWHDLRKALKRFRYLVAAFGSQHRSGQVKPVRKQLRKLQLGIGAVQDLRIQQELVEELRQHAALVGLGGAGQVCSRLEVVLERRLAEARRECAGAWVDFDTPATRKAVRRLTRP